MNRRIRLASRWTLVVSLTTVMTASPASAGWLLHRLHCHHQYTRCTAVVAPCGPVCPPPVPMNCPPSDGCCGAAGVAPVIATPMQAVPWTAAGCCESAAPSVDAPWIEGAPVGEGPMTEQPHDAWQPREGEMAPPPPPEPAAPVPPAEPVPPAAPVPPAESAPSDPVPPEPAPAEPLESPSDLPDETETEPEAAEPAVPPADEFDATDEDPFGAPADPATEPEPAEDPFGAPPAEPPAEEPMEDLFGTEPDEAPVEPPATDSPPADAPLDVEEPAAGESLEDLFGSEVPQQPADGAAALDVGAPIGQTPPLQEVAKPALDNEDNIDDLFGTEPLSEPAAVEAAEDLSDDLFGEPANEAVEPETITVPDGDSPDTENSDPLDDLFGESHVEDAPSTAATDSIDERPQASVAILATRTPPADPLAQTAVRTWIDNTGTFSTQGRLFEINADNVRLLKVNGKTCTVPWNRLSLADAAYVDAIRQQIDKVAWAAQPADR